jgi:hypothetical protein
MTAEYVKGEAVYEFRIASIVCGYYLEPNHCSMWGNVDVIFFVQMSVAVLTIVRNR